MQNIPIDGGFARIVFDLFLCGIRFAEADVVGYGIRKEEDVLGGIADIPAQIVQIVLAQVFAIHFNGAGGNLIHALQQFGQRTLSGARLPHYGHLLPGLQLKADVL